MGEKGGPQIIVVERYRIKHPLVEDLLGSTPAPNSFKCISDMPNFGR